MNKLDRYLDEVCRGIGGPRAMRQHVRQELREHLLDAAAEHQRAGLSEEEAIQRALDDFGVSADVRSGLQATYGHRLMAIVIDKAMQWKETTMRSKFLWLSAAHLAIGLVVALEVAFMAALLTYV